MTRTDFYMLMSVLYLSQTMGKTACLVAGLAFVALTIVSIVCDKKAAA